MGDEIDDGCPACGTGAGSERYCTRCGFELGGPAAAELRVLLERVRATDRELAAISARRQVAASDYERRRATLRSAVAPSGTEGAPAAEAAWSGTRREVSPDRVRNTLLWLGTALLALSALTFTAVAWTRLDDGGRALLLAAVTIGATFLAVAAAHRLPATGEALSGLAIALAIIDCYALRRAGVGAGLSAVAWWSIGTAGVAGFAGALGSRTGPRTTRFAVATLLPVSAVLIVATACSAAWSVAIGLAFVATRARARRREVLVSRARRDALRVGAGRSSARMGGGHDCRRSRDLRWRRHFAVGRAGRADPSRAGGARARRRTCMQGRDGASRVVPAFARRDARRRERRRRGPRPAGCHLRRERYGDRRRSARRGRRHRGRKDAGTLAWWRRRDRRGGVRPRSPRGHRLPAGRDVRSARLVPGPVERKRISDGARCVRRSGDALVARGDHDFGRRPPSCRGRGSRSRHHRRSTPSHRRPRTRARRRRVRRNGGRRPPAPRGRRVGHGRVRAHCHCVQHHDRRVRRREPRPTAIEHCSPSRSVRCPRSPRSGGQP